AQGRAAPGPGRGGPLAGGRARIRAPARRPGGVRRRLSQGRRRARRRAIHDEISAVPRARGFGAGLPGPEGPGRRCGAGGAAVSPRGRRRAWIGLGALAALNAVVFFVYTVPKRLEERTLEARLVTLRAQVDQERATATRLRRKSRTLQANV